MWLKVLIEFCFCCGLPIDTKNMFYIHCKRNLTVKWKKEIRILRKFWHGGSIIKYMGVSKNSPQITHFNRVFHYKPSILGYPYFWKPPYLQLMLPLGILTCFGSRGSRKTLSSWICQDCILGVWEELASPSIFSVRPTIGSSVSWLPFSQRHQIFGPQHGWYHPVSYRAQESDVEKPEKKVVWSIHSRKLTCLLKRD